MNTFFLFVFFISSGWAQLETPVAEGSCTRDEISASFTLANGLLKILIKEKGIIRNCDFELVNSSSFERIPIRKETLYFIPSSCDGRLVKESGFKKGNIIDRGFLEISQAGGSGQAILSAFSHVEPMGCNVSVNSWKKLEELSLAKRKKN
jgi:hypothetical protein